MKKLLPAIAVLAAAANASAQLLFEPFNYTASILDGQVNPGNALPWEKMAFDPDVEDNILISNSNVGYSGLAASTGRSVTYGGEGASQRLGLGQDFTSGTLYYSLIFQVTTPLTATPAFIGGFSNVSGPADIGPQTVGTRLYLQQGPSSTQQNPTFRVGVSKNSSIYDTDPLNSDIIFDPREFTLNTPIFVVGSYSIVGTALGTDDVARLWINPASGTFGASPAPTADLSAPLAGTDLRNATATGPQVGGFVLRQASVSVPAVQVDELRVDRTWAQVTPPVGIAWNVNGGGLWSEDVKWSTFARPNSAGAFVNFGPVATGAAAINVDGTYALRAINFTGNGPYTLGGAGTLAFSSAAAVNVMAGSHAIGAPMSMGGDMLASVRSGSTLTLTNVSSNSNSFTKTGAGSLELTNARFNTLDIVGGKVRVLPDGSNAAVSKVTALSINTPYSASLDLTNNDMVIDYAGASPLGTWDGAAYTGVLGAIQSGRNGGTWNGAGIITSESAAVGAPPRTTLGVAESSSILGLTGSATALWRGQTVDATSLLIKYTYAGDANLDGRIDADDYFIIDRNYPLSGSVFGYARGDFDYNGQINGDDYFIIDSSFLAQGAPPSAAWIDGAASAVPEPVSLGIISLTAAHRLLRRRRS